eukprot:1214728-Pleurochrysis_carterae.AAC.1
MLRQVEDFIVEGGGRRKPSRWSKDAYEKKLGSWIDKQQTNYKKGARLMRNAAIREEWFNFVEAHAALFFRENVAYDRLMSEIDD